MWKNLFFNDTSILSVTKLHCGTKGEARAFFKARLIRSVWLFCSKEKRYYPWKCLTLGIFMLLLFVYIWHFLQKFMTLCCGYIHGYSGPHLFWFCFQKSALSYTGSFPWKAALFLRLPWWLHFQTIWFPCKCKLKTIILLIWNHFLVPKLRFHWGFSSILSPIKIGHLTSKLKNFCIVFAILKAYKF